MLAIVATLAPPVLDRNRGGLPHGAGLRSLKRLCWALDAMGQYTVIVPSHDLVVVRRGPSPGGHEAYMSGIVGQLTAAMDR